MARKRQQEEGRGKRGEREQQRRKQTVCRQIEKRHVFMLRE